MRFAQVAGISALVYISLVESEFLLSYSSEPVYKNNLTEQEVHIANGLVNKSVFKRVKKEGKIAFIRNHQINENEIHVRIPLKETQTQQEETALNILMNHLRQWEGFKDESYDDADQVSIGYGRRANGDTSTTRKREEEYLRKRAQAELDYINKHIPGLNKHQQAAVGSLRYNIGAGALESSKAWEALQAGDHATFEKEAFDKDKGFVYSQGQKILADRRAKERELWLRKLQQKQQEQQKARDASTQVIKPDPYKKSPGQIEFEKDPMAYRLKYGGDEFDD